MHPQIEIMAPLPGEGSITVLHGGGGGFEAMFHCVSSVLHVGRMIKAPEYLVGVRVGCSTTASVRVWEQQFHAVLVG